MIKAFTPAKMELTVSDVAALTALARPTARRLLITLEKLGYVRSFGARYLLTPKTLELGTVNVSAQGMWDVARPHLVSMVDKTGESSSMSQLDCGARSLRVGQNNRCGQRIGECSRDINRSIEEKVPAAVDGCG